MELAQLTSALGGHRTNITAARPAPPTVEAVYATGHWLLAQGRMADAAKVFRCMLHVAPRDERGWLGLGECHERHGQPRVAAELFGAGAVVAAPSVRCLLGRARSLRTLDRDDEADRALTQAEELAAAGDDGELVALVAYGARGGA